MTIINQNVVTIYLYIFSEFVIFFQKNMLACLDVRSIGTLAKFHLFAFTFERETWSKQVTRPNRRRDNEVGLNLLRKYAEAIFRIKKKKENGNKNGGTASEKKKMTIRLNWPKNDNNNNRINLQLITQLNKQ